MGLFSLIINHIYTTKEEDFLKTILDIKLQTLNYRNIALQGHKKLNIFYCYPAGQQVTDILINIFNLKLLELERTGELQIYRSPFTQHYVRFGQTPSIKHVQMGSEDPIGVSGIYIYRQHFTYTAIQQKVGYFNDFCIRSLRLRMFWSHEHSEQESLNLVFYISSRSNLLKYNSYCTHIACDLSNS